MNSIATSDETILNIENLEMAYRLDYYKDRNSNTFRDAFVGLINSPMKKLFHSPDYYHVLKDINLTLKKGDRLALIGVNGAGKTTLCRLINGMLEPHRGVLDLKGEVRSVFNTGIGVAPELTGRENAELLSWLIYPNISKEKREEVLQESLEFSGLGEFLDVPYLNYSKGMQTRLYLSLVSALPCDLLILDEVFDGADANFQEKVSKRVIDLIENSGSAICVSHNPEKLKMTCNRAVVLSDAKIIYDGTVTKALSIYSLLEF